MKTSSCARISHFQRHGATFTQFNRLHTKVVEHQQAVTMIDGFFQRFLQPVALLPGNAGVPGASSTDVLFQVVKTASSVKRHRLINIKDRRRPRQTRILFRAVA